MIRALLGFALSAGLFIATPQGIAAEGYRDAREQVPAALIGPWKVDLAASKYPGNKPQSALRTFQYTADGRVLVTFMTLAANGTYSTGHWAAHVDGSPGIEYHSSAGSIPYNVVSFKKINETTLNLTVTRHGKVTLEAVYTLSADGKTLTYAYGDTVIVYRRWDKMD